MWYYSYQSAAKRSVYRKKHADYLKTDTWKTKRLKVLQRDRHHCRKCGTENDLEVHHLTYKRFGNEKLTDLITLCRNCHNKQHPDKLKFWL